MNTENHTAIPYIIFIFNTAELVVGLFTLCFGYTSAAAIMLFLIALNLIIGQIYLLHLPVSPASESDQEENEPVELLSLNPSDIDEQILELTRKNTVLTEQNRILSGKVEFYEKQLLSAPILYQCPLTSAVPINLGKTLRAYYDEHSADFSRCGLHSSLHTETGSFETLLSKAAFIHICDNLLDNTLKYTPADGTVVITLSAQGKDALLIWKNTGKGIPEDEADKVFGLNYRINQAGSGTGFGLTQIQAIMDDFGGKVWARSSLENGFAVYIQIPRQKGETK